MTGYDDSRWHERCFSRCGHCVSCLQLDNSVNGRPNNVVSKRFVTVGSVRYGVRLGAVSPPPPGAGPRYRSKCCWTSTSGPDFVSQIPLLATQTINSGDIFSCVNRMRMVEDATSELPDQTLVRGQVLYSTKSLLKNQLRRRAVIRPEVYTRLCECGHGEKRDIFNNLDRLPRFRFGGNRNNNITKERERDKNVGEHRLRELTDRLKKAPVSTTRKHTPRKFYTTPSTDAENIEDDTFHSLPLRSASFSQGDYSSNDRKYVRRKYSPQEICSQQTNCNEEVVLPRSKNCLVRLSSFNADKQPPSYAIPTITGNLDKCVEENVRDSSEMIRSECDNNETVVNPSGTLTELVSFQNPNVYPATNECDKSTNEVENSNKLKVDQSAQEKKRDKSRRRKGMYISQWPNSYQSSENLISHLVRENVLSLGDNLTPNLPHVQVNCDNLNDDSADAKLPSPEDNLLSTEWFNKPSRSFEEPDCLVKSNQLLRTDSLSEGESEKCKSENPVYNSDVSDCEIRSSSEIIEQNSQYLPQRYSKRPLRGPYGQMLEAEMKKPEMCRKNQFKNDLKFLEDITGSSGTSLSCSNSVGAGDPKPKCINRMRGSSNHSLDDTQFKNCLNYLANSEKYMQSPIKRKVSIDLDALRGVRQEQPEQQLVVSHQRTTSSPSKLEGINSSVDVSNELLEHLLRGSSEQLATNENLQRYNDTRTHVVVELFDTERSYVESLQILVLKYLEPLKSSENAGLLDAPLVDEIFFQIPSLLNYHQVFLEELKKRLDHWDNKQKVGDIFLETFSKPTVIDSYTNYVNNWKRARNIIKNAQQSKPTFAKFLESTAREHKGKLALDSLLIKPIQKFPKYELLIQRLIKHTDLNHPDHSLLISAQKEIHDLLLKINCTEREALELEQLREIESLIEGLIELVAADRQYLRHDLVSMAASGGTRKERALFLFSDLLLVTSIKRKSGTIRKPVSGQGSVTSTLEANKYKLLMKISLDDLEIVKAKDESLKQMMVEIENLTEDVSILNQINDLTYSLHCHHASLDEIVKDMMEKIGKQLTEQQNSDSQLACLEMTLNTTNGLENISIAFSKPEKRVSWEESFNEAKHKLAVSGDRRPTPELIAAVPIRKTRAGLQFTCAAPTIGDNRKDVWVCNSDGYVGQVCVLSLQPEPNVTSCNGVCNARIICIASIPGSNSELVQNYKDSIKAEVKEDHNSAIHFDSSSSSEDEEKSDIEENIESNSRSSAAIRFIETTSTDSEETDHQQSTMWLGTEDGCIYVYNSIDNIRIKKSKIKLQHGFSILSIIYYEDKVYVALANGDIIIYERESSGGWNTNSPITVSVGSTAIPVSRMIPDLGKLWCGCGNTIKVFNTETLVIENSLTVNNDANKPITSIVLSGNAVWLSLQNSAIVKCFHTISFELLCEVNVAPAVTKMLTSCDDIIRQHKAACLRVTSLLASKDLLWIGTSAGVLLTMLLPHITPTTTKMSNTPCVIGVPYGHTGHVRFLTNMEYQTTNGDNTHNRYSYKGKPEQRNNSKLLVISGGDGYEDFRSANISEVAGREDSTNHLLLWNI